MSSDDSKGSFLDKGEVTDRTVKVVKNFPKIEDPSKVYAVALVPSLSVGYLERPMLASIKSAIKMLSAPIWMLLPFLNFFLFRGGELALCDAFPMGSGLFNRYKSGFSWMAISRQVMILVLLQNALLSMAIDILPALALQLVRASLTA
jgi:hypothetical protein